MNYYTAPDTPKIRGRLSSEEIRDQWSAIESAFSMLPPVAQGGAGLDGGRWANAILTGATITGSTVGTPEAPNVGHFKRLHVAASTETATLPGQRAWVANTAGDWRLLKESVTHLLIDYTGSVVIGDGENERSTSSITGLFYLPTVNGTPTGTPQSRTGAAPMLYDRATNKIGVYNGTWKFTAALS